MKRIEVAVNEDRGFVSAQTMPNGICAGMGVGPSLFSLEHMEGRGLCLLLNREYIEKQKEALAKLKVEFVSSRIQPYRKDTRICECLFLFLNAI